MDNEDEDVYLMCPVCGEELEIEEDDFSTTMIHCPACFFSIIDVGAGEEQ